MLGVFGYKLVTGEPELISVCSAQAVRVSPVSADQGLRAVRRHFFVGDSEVNTAGEIE